MGGRCYPEECEIEVVRQATDRGYSVFIVAIRLVFCCVSHLSLRLAQQSCLSRVYPIYPKNRKTALRPCPAWIQRGSQSRKAPLRIWFYPQ